MNDRDAVVEFSEVMANVRNEYQEGESAKALAKKYKVPYDVVRHMVADIKEPRAGRPRQYVRLKIDDLAYVRNLLADNEVQEATRALDEMMSEVM
jgi:hypothetical protein